MKRLARILPFAIVGSLALVAMLAAAGALLPRSYTVASSVFYHQPVDSVWAAVADIERSPSWRTGIKAVERLPDRHGHPAWSLTSDEGIWLLEVVEVVPNQLYEASVTDEAQAVGGSWAYYFRSENDGTRLILFDNGFISNPFFRLLGRCVSGLNAPLDEYLKALGRRFGEEVRPTHLPPSPG